MFSKYMDGTEGEDIENPLDSKIGTQDPPGQTQQILIGWSGSSCSLSLIPFSYLMGFSHSFSSVCSCAKTCPASPQSTLTVGQARHVTHLNLKDSSIHLSSNWPSPSTGIEIIG